MQHVGNDLIFDVSNFFCLVLIDLQVFNPCSNFFLRYVIVYKKGYQEFQEPYSSVTTKVKGLSLTDLTRSGPEFPLYGGVHVWDSSDFVVPPEVQTFSSNHNN